MELRPSISIFDVLLFSYGIMSNVLCICILDNCPSYKVLNRGLVQLWDRNYRDVEFAWSYTSYQLVSAMR